MKHVAAAIIFNNQHELLICQRKEGGSCSNLWEFPGGKLELDETMEECCIRECREELAVKIEILSLYAETSYVYPENEIHFVFYLAKLLSDEKDIKMNVHQDIRWVAVNQLDDYTFCPADIELIQRIKYSNK